MCKPLKTFSVRFGGGAYYDESAHARAVARTSGRPIWTRAVSRELVDLLPELIYHMDFALPVWGAFGYIAVSRLAKRHVKVSLTGHGGDEVFAGYPKHFGATSGSTESSISRPAVAQPSTMHRLRTVFHHEGAVAGPAAARRVRRPPSLRGSLGRIALRRGARYHPMLHPRFVHARPATLRVESYLRPLREAKTDEILDKCLYHDLRVYLQDSWLWRIGSAWPVSLESRVPFLDHRIVELVARIPPALKVRERQPKHLLSEVARPLLPASIVDRRDKSPFPIPLEQWFADKLFGAASDLLKSERCLDRGVLHPDRLREKTIPPSLAWQLINIELWYRICVDRDPKWVEQTKLLTSEPVGRRA